MVASKLLIFFLLNQKEAKNQAKTPNPFFFAHSTLQLRQKN
jgi:hypothetical protein